MYDMEENTCDKLYIEEDGKLMARFVSVCGQLGLNQQPEYFATRIPELEEIYTLSKGLKIKLAISRLVMQYWLSKNKGKLIKWLYKLDKDINFRSVLTWPMEHIRYLLKETNFSSIIYMLNSEVSSDYGELRDIIRHMGSHLKSVAIIPDP